MEGRGIKREGGTRTITAKNNQTQKCPPELQRGGRAQERGGAVEECAFSLHPSIEY